MSYQPPVPPRPDLVSSWGPVSYARWPFASRLARLGGALVDGFALAPLYAVLFLLFGRTAFDHFFQVVQQTPPGQPPNPSVFFHLEAGFLWIDLAGWIFVGVYEVLLTRYRGQTLGKMAAGTVVVRKADGELPSWGQAIVRYVVKAVLNWISEIFILWDKELQALHDKAAGTIVLEKGR